MRTFFALTALLLLATFAPLRPFRAEPIPATVFMAFDPVPLDRSDVARRRIGRLEFLGGWSVRSNDPRFGGVSAIAVQSGAMLAASDTGDIARFPLAEAGRVRGHISRVPKAGAGKRDRDVEAMAVSGDAAWLVFERSNSVRRYALPDWKHVGAARPTAMRRWRANRGGEAVVALADGRFLVFAEGSRKGRESQVILFDGDPADPATPVRTLRYRPPAGYSVTDAGALPDGRILILNRRYAFAGGISAKLAIAAPDGLLAGEEIADLRAPLTIDNMEALSIGEEGGRTIVWLASDDNFNPLQRTLLMKFALVE